MSGKNLSARYDRLDNDRLWHMEQARKASAHSDPTILPPRDRPKDSELPETFQSVGSRGLISMSGRMLLALFPPDQPWFRLELPMEIESDQRFRDEQILQAKQILFNWESIIVSTLDSVGAADESARVRSSFRSRKRMAIDQLLVTGDVLEYLTPDYRLRVFRRDQYVTKRDSAGDVLYHITKEQIDPLALSDEQLARLDLDRETLSDKQVDDRMLDLYTLVEWQPQAKNWVIRQEINDTEFDDPIEETVSPYFSTPFKLTPGEDYGIGFFMLNGGELASLNELEARRLELLALASKGLIGIDIASQVRPDDLTKRSGSVVTGLRVEGGQVQDVAAFGFGQVREFSMLTEGIRDKTKTLSAAMLIESAVQPQKERVTATQIERIAFELDGALGGLYTPIADNQQIPLLRRMIVQLKRDNKLPEIRPAEIVQITTLTGLAALQRNADATKLAGLSDFIQRFGPEALQIIDIGRLTDEYLRLVNINERGIVKSEEQRAAERRAAIEMAAAQQAVQSAGAIAEQQAQGAANGNGS